ncbi:uncharacterized protein [Henckelia pumila]|uniref:uncharacterized protein n=1 Tax=Henckelia pumila TaxID=405737 RepID=UPI003C6E31C5
MNKSTLQSQDCFKYNEISLPKSKYKVLRRRSLIYLSASSIVLFGFFQITSLPNFMYQWQEPALNSSLLDVLHCRKELKSLSSKLRESVTFLPLKDLRFTSSATKGHTWFMSSLYDTHEEGEVQYQHFPSKASRGKILCLKGRNKHDGSWNSYALALPEALPQNATLMKGITFVSYNHYDYSNIWHGLSAMMPFVAWHIKKGCMVRPKRWILYHWGELRTDMSPWLRALLAATFNTKIYIENFEGKEFDGDDTTPACFEETVVMRHNEGGMSREKRMEVYDLMRCKSRMYCNVSSEETPSRTIRMTMLMRNGARSFKNSSAVVDIFGKECKKVEGCRLMVAYSHNLTFCEQVKVMSLTDILISPHGAQLSNMVLMDRNSSVMEFFPKGWLELAGVGQFVYHWLASWSGMKHEGAWRDPVGDRCPYPEDDHRCMPLFKNSRIGHNESHFSEWVRHVLSEDNDSQPLVGFVDSDYARNLDIRKSLTRLVFTTFGTAISWKSVLQSVVDLSTTEDEYIAVTEGIKEALWLKGMITELGLKKEMVEVHCDNQSTIHLSKHQIFHERSKHIDVKLHIVRDIIAKGEVKVEK